MKSTYCSLPIDKVRVVSCAEWYGEYTTSLLHANEPRNNLPVSRYTIHTGNMYIYVIKKTIMTMSTILEFILNM